MAAESKIEKYLRAEIAKLGGWCEKHTSPGTRGVPDNIVMWHSGDEDWPVGFIYACASIGSSHFTSQRPVVEFIETKAPDGKLTVLQAKDHERRRAMGFTVHVIATMEAAEAYLRSRGKK